MSSQGGNKRQRLLDATEVLQEVARTRSVLQTELSDEERTALLDATGLVFCGHPNRHKSLAAKRAADRQVLQNTGIRRLRNQPVYVTPRPLSLTTSSVDAVGLEEEERNRTKMLANTATECGRKCYVCKAKYTSVHHFYDRLCPDNESCAPLNFRKRGELADLSGKVRIACKLKHPLAGCPSRVPAPLGSGMSSEEAVGTPSKLHETPVTLTLYWQGDTACFFLLPLRHMS